MKIIAVSAGRKNGNTEILLKEALMRAEELGAEVKLINLHDYNILPCTGCEACTVSMTQKNTKPRCIHNNKDDMELIMKEWLTSDGVIVGAPTYELQPAGIFRIWSDRFLPYEVVLLKESGVIDEIPKRVGGLIAVGGSTRSWMSFVLESLNISMYMQSIKVIDQFMATNVPRPGQVLLDNLIMEKARKLGENIYYAAKQPYDKVEYVGEDKGWCPVCHSNNLALGEPHWDHPGFKIECSVCGAGGNLEKDEEDNWKFVLADDGMLKCRITDKGRANHFFEIQHNHNKYYEKSDIIKEKLEKYKKYKIKSI